MAAGQALVNEQHLGLAMRAQAEKSFAEFQKALGVEKELWRQELQAELLLRDARETEIMGQQKRLLEKVNLFSRMFVAQEDFDRTQACLCKLKKELGNQNLAFENSRVVPQLPVDVK